MQCSTASRRKIKGVKIAIQHMAHPDRVAIADRDSYTLRFGRGAVRTSGRRRYFRRLPQIRRQLENSAGAPAAQIVTPVDTCHKWRPSLRPLHAIDHGRECMLLFWVECTDRETCLLEYCSGAHISSYPHVRLHLYSVG